MYFQSSLYSCTICYNSESRMDSSTKIKQNKRFGPLAKYYNGTVHRWLGWGVFTSLV